MSRWPFVRALLVGVGLTMGLLAAGCLGAPDEVEVSSGAIGDCTCSGWIDESGECVDGAWSCPSQTCDETGCVEDEPAPPDVPCGPGSGLFLCTPAPCQLGDPDCEDDDADDGDDCENGYDCC